MNEIILELAALLLTSFCLGFSAARRRQLYFPLPSGLKATLSSQHAAYLGMLVTLILSAAS